jgi:uncharacterized protein with ParB-like and HNH nuclease domain
MPPTIGEKIIQFTGQASGENQIPAHALINDVTKRAVKIKQHPLHVFFDRNFRIPDYQRGYQWEEENWEQLWEEIDKLFQTDAARAEASINDVFFGSMFFAEREGEDVGEEDIEELYDVIDGQQRLTTLTILFKIMADQLYKQLDEGDLHREFSGEVTDIENLVYQQVGVGTENRVSLIPNRHHKSFFDAVLGDEDDLLEYLLSCDRVHGNTKYDAIQVQDYLDAFGIDETDYLAAIDDDEYYEDDVDRRSNLTSNQLTNVQSQDDMSSVDVESNFANDLLTNKVEISDENQNFIDAYVFYRDNLVERLNEFETPKQRSLSLINLKNHILHSFQVGYFEVQNDQPRLLMKIFEILNDRGMELKKADVMRTRIVACFRDDPSRDEYVKKWEEIVSLFGNDRIIEFLRTYFVITGHAKSRGELKDHLLEAFVQNPGPNTNPKLDSQIETPGEAKEFIDDLTIYAKYYDHITDINNKGIDLGEDGDEEVANEADRIITRLRKADTSIWEPLVLGVYHDIVENDISKQETLVKLLRAVESMAIRKFAAMDTHTRDRAYANAVEEYHSDGIDGDLVDVLTDIETEDPNTVGERLVESFYQRQWGKQWGKQILRKIVSENFSTSQSQMVLRQLNLNEDIVHLEHIFPQTPIRSSNGDKYEWFKQFFKTDEDEEIQDMISSFIENENDETLNEIAEHYQSDIGNLTLLHYQGNISIGNELFDAKALKYKSTEDFCELTTSEYICDYVLAAYASHFEEYAHLVEAETKLEAEEADDDNGHTWSDIAASLELDVESEEELLNEIADKKESITSELESLKQEWNYETVTKNRSHLVRELCEIIAFSDDEFEDVDFQSISEQETTTKNEIITANFRRRLE